METVKLKPVVHFVGTPRFDTDMYPGHEVALVHAVDHNIWGHDVIRTSSVLKKFSDGSFETLNTVYRPVPKDEEDEH